MADINISIDSNVKELEKKVAQANRILEKAARDQERIDSRLSRKKARNRLKEMRETRRAEEKNTDIQERIDDRLSRKRARNRLKDIRTRVRAEKSAQREIEKSERIASERRSRLFKRGVGTAIGLGVAGVAAGIYAGRGILDYNTRLARTAVQAKKSREEQIALGEAITQTAVKRGIDRDEILTTFEKIVDKSGEFDLASQNLDKIAKVLVGTGADASELGSLMAALATTFKGMEGIKPFDFLEVLIAQGDDASINLAEMAAYAEKLFGAFKTSGLQGKQSFIEFSALAQIAGGGGTSAEAATMTSGLLKQLGKNSEKINKYLAKQKLPAITGKGGVLNNLGTILPNILKATGGDINEINKLIPEAEAATPLKILAEEYRRLNGELRTFNHSIDLGANAAENVATKYDRVSMEAGQAFEKMSALGTALADKALVSVIDDLANSMNKLLSDPEKMKQLENTFKALAELLKVALKVTGFGVNILGGIVSPWAESSVNQSRPNEIKRRINQLPETARDRFRKKMGVGFNSPIDQYTTPGRLNAMESELTSIEMNVSVINNANGTTDVKMTGLNNSDTGSKRFTKQITGAKAWRFYNAR